MINPLFHALLAATALFSSDPGAGDKADPAPAAGAIVKLSNEVVCRGVKVQLRDVAEIITVDSKLKKRLATLDLGHPPGRSYTREIRVDKVKQAIEKAGFSLQRVKVAGASRVLVGSRTRTIPPQRLEDAAELVLGKVIENLEEEDITYALSTRVRPRTVPAGRIGIDVTAALRGGRIGRSHALVDVLILVDGREAVKVPLQFTLRRFRRVLVPCTTIRRETPLNEGNLHLVKLDLTSFHGEPLTELAEVAGKVARRMLPGGRPITAADLKTPDLVEKGELVTMVGRRGNLTITMKGIARASGTLGDHIRVMNITSKRIVTGRIAGRGVIEIY